VREICGKTIPVQLAFLPTNNFILAGTASLNTD
jgi:hypothetical protein